MAGPCSWTVDTGCCVELWDSLTPEAQDRASAFATYTMWAATGRQFGLCEMTVRPCGRGCEQCSVGWYWDSGTWTPYVLDGVWRNCWCGGFSGCCTCAPHCQVYLPGPVQQVSQVVVDGAVVDPATYRVDDNRWLVRIRTGPNDDSCWPLCADFNVEAGEGFFQVTYTRGTPVPAAVSAAAGTLACEFAKACAGLECRLPGRVTNIVRQGVSVSLVDVGTLLEAGLTGIMEVDQVITAVNPHRLKGRTRFYSPDVPAVRTVTQA